ncbi:hypothetical protein [Sporosarcina sp. OR05]|uniref:hypothetical protein n=1 Tax=Sporosarcina sp. OR05 TaxID=2969819 RepID=UPI00352A2220
MTILSSIILFLIPVFLLFLSLTFRYASKAKDEQEKKILLKSYQYSAAVFPIGWLLIEIYYRFFNNITIDVYRDYMILLIYIMFIAQGISILLLKRRNPSNVEAR